MALAQRQPAELTDAVVQRLADIVGIPADQGAAFSKGLPGLFQLTRHWHAADIAYRQRMPVIERQLAELKAALEIVRERLAKLDKGARTRLGVYALHHKNFGAAATPKDLRFNLNDLVDGGGRGEGRLLLEFYDYVVDELHAAASTREWPTGSRGGQLSKALEIPGNPLVSAFDLFSVELSRYVRLCGGKLTLDKNAGTGTTIEFLRLATAHLPHGLVPPGVLAADENGKMSGLSRLREMIAEGRGRKLARATGQQPMPK